jgi:hypothetical protein
VLILGNIDDATFLVEARSTGGSLDTTNSQPFLAYIPQSENGSTLITSRNSGAALKLVEESDIMTIEPMGGADVLSLFRKKLRMPGESKDVAELVALLEFMPLAIVQAAAYISQKAPRCSVRQYIEKFQGSDKEKTSLFGSQEWTP